MNQEQQKEFRQFLQSNYSSKDKNINLSVQYQRPIHLQGVFILKQIINWPILSINLRMQQLIRLGSNWKTITILTLQRNQITSDGLVGLKNACWDQLQEINLYKNRIGAKGMKYIAEAEWKNIKKIELSYNQIKNEGAKMISEAQWDLVYLGLNFNLIGNQGMKYLSRSKFSKLKQLELSNNKLDAKGMYYLQLMELPSLHSLMLNRNTIGRERQQITEIGCIYLSKLKSKSLQYLHVYGNDITLEGIRIILYNAKLAENCFLELIRNLFTYSEISEDVKKLKLFCNYFE